MDYHLLKGDFKADPLQANSAETRRNVSWENILPLKAAEQCHPSEHTATAAALMDMKMSFRSHVRIPFNQITSDLCALFITRGHQNRHQWNIGVWTYNK